MTVKEVQQARAATTTLAALVGKAGQWIIDKTTWRPHIMDGVTPGGHPVALKADTDALSTSVGQKANDADVVKVVAQTLTDEQKEQALENQGVLQAIRELITEYGGTVPTSLSSQSATTMAAGSDPWGDFN